MNNMDKTFALFFFIIIAFSACAYAFASHISVSGSHIVLMIGFKEIAVTLVLAAVVVLIVSIVKRKIIQK